tara:strand:- start:153 stop:998 length:846 start_codon:yes stop_codon:yes gene_type:complete
MWINVIDYRGKDKTDPLYIKRTQYFQAQQIDFKHWQKHGHKFRCFTQHKDPKHFYLGFDEVVYFEQRKNSEARAYIMDWLYKNDPNWDWTAMWDNDATVYWDRPFEDKFNSNDVPEHLHNICKTADDYNIKLFTPLFPKIHSYKGSDEVSENDIFANGYHFKPVAEAKGTMLFIKNMGLTFDTSLDAMSDYDYACNVRKQPRSIVAHLQQLALKEYGDEDTSIMFKTIDFRKNQIDTNREKINAKWGINTKDWAKTNRANTKIEKLTKDQNFQYYNLFESN